jgi:hypothetical protein
MRPFRDTEPGRKLEALNHLYKVEERWDQSLDEIEEQAFRRISQFFSLKILSGDSTIDSQDLEEALKILIALTERDNWGRDPFSVAVTWVIKSYLDELEMRDEQAPIFAALSEWASSKPQLTENLIKRADKLISRTSS